MAPSDSQHPEIGAEVEEEGEGGGGQNKTKQTWRPLKSGRGWPRTAKSRKGGTGASEGH